MLTPGEVRALLRRHGLAPHKAFGQNFVTDANTVRKVVRDAGVGPGDHVVEVGPGLGSLTLALREVGARVTAVEVDAGMVRALHEVLAGDEGVRVVHADALAVDYLELTGDEPATLVANLPYNTATPIALTAMRSRAFDRLFVMVQREVGERWSAGAGDALYGAVSVKMAALADVSVVARVSRNAFYPVPNVDSVTVSMMPRRPPAGVPLEWLFRMVEAGFAQRRKQLRNTLTAAGPPSAAVEQALTAMGHSRTARAEELDLDAWAALTRRLA